MWPKTAIARSKRGIKDMSPKKDIAAAKRLPLSLETSARTSFANKYRFCIALLICHANGRPLPGSSSVPICPANPVRILFYRCQSLTSYTSARYLSYLNAVGRNLLACSADSSGGDSVDGWRFLRPAE